MNWFMLIVITTIYSTKALASVQSIYLSKSNINRIFSKNRRYLPGAFNSDRILIK